MSRYRSKSDIWLSMYGNNSTNMFSLEYEVAVFTKGNHIKHYLCLLCACLHGAFANYRCSIFFNEDLKLGMGTRISLMDYHWVLSIFDFSITYTIEFTLSDTTIKCCRRTCTTTMEASFFLCSLLRGHEILLICLCIQIKHRPVLK